jgi:hypothetical protein
MVSLKARLRNIWGILRDNRLGVKETNLPETIVETLHVMYAICLLARSCQEVCHVQKLSLGFDFLKMN